MSSSGTFVDRIDPFAKRSLKKKQKKSQGSSRYRTGGDVELTALPLLKGQFISVLRIFWHFLCSTIFIHSIGTGLPKATQKRSTFFICFDLI